MTTDNTDESRLERAGVTDPVRRRCGAAARLVVAGVAVVVMLFAAPVGAWAQDGYDGGYEGEECPEGYEGYDGYEGCDADGGGGGGGEEGGGEGGGGTNTSTSGTEDVDLPLTGGVALVGAAVGAAVGALGLRRLSRP